MIGFVEVLFVVSGLLFKLFRTVDAINARDNCFNSSLNLLFSFDYTDMAEGICMDVLRYVDTAS